MNNPEYDYFADPSRIVVENKSPEVEKVVQEMEIIVSGNANLIAKAEDGLERRRNLVEKCDKLIANADANDTDIVNEIRRINELVEKNVAKLVEFIAETKGLMEKEKKSIEEIKKFDEEWTNQLLNISSEYKN